tara:strand:+ start:1597 stop:1788 length:192 start_codon:yes stop_codon:yes gene_type:complete
VEVIKRRRNNRLPIEDLEIVESVLRDLMADRERRDRLGSEAKKGCGRFELKNIMIQWEKLLVK